MRIMLSSFGAWCTLSCVGTALLPGCDNGPTATPPYREFDPPGFGVSERSDTLAVLDGELVQREPDALRIGELYVSTPGLLAFSIFEHQVVWIGAGDAEPILHVQRLDPPLDRTAPLMAAGGVTDIYPDVEGAWLRTRTGLSYVAYPPESAKTEPDLHYVMAYQKADMHPVDVAVQPGIGLWVAEDFRVKRLEGDTEHPLNWPRPEKIQRLLVEQEHLWILTLSGRLLAIDLADQAVTQDITLAGPGIAIAPADDGFYVALGVQADVAGRTVAIHHIGHDGSPRWVSDDIASCRSAECRSLVVTSNRVIYGGSGKFVALNPSTGKRIEAE